MVPAVLQPLKMNFYDILLAKNFVNSIVFHTFALRTNY